VERTHEDRRPVDEQESADFRDVALERRPPEPPQFRDERRGAGERVADPLANLLTDDVTRALRAAADRGVDVNLAGVSDGVEATVREAVPDAETFASLWTFADTPAGRVVMIDGRMTLVSVLADDGGAATEREETAIWGTGETNSLVVVLRALFTWQLADDTGRDGRAP
jgi:hypothetical protein